MLRELRPLHRILFSALLVSTLAARLFVASADYRTLIALDIYRDDAFYYPKIARNLLDGRGLTFDGTNPSNGFHPLYLFTLLPLKKISGDDLIAPIRLSALALSAVAVLSAALLFRLALFVAGRSVAFTALAIFAISPYFVAFGINGQETGVAMRSTRSRFRQRAGARSGSRSRSHSLPASSPFSLPHNCAGCAPTVLSRAACSPTGPSSGPGSLRARGSGPFKRGSTVISAGGTSSISTAWRTRPHTALEQKRLHAYLRAERIDYILDWSWIVNSLCLRHAPPGSIGLRAIGRSSARPPAVLYAVESGG